MDISLRLFVRIVIASFALAIALHIALFISGLYAISADESGRLLDAVAWAKTSSVTVDAWLPFYQVSVGTALRLYNDWFVAPRLVSFGCGLLAHGALIALAWELFRRRDIAAVTAIISAVIHHRVILAVVPLAEIMYFAALIASMAFLARRLRTGSVAALVLCALCLAAATTIRYEAWFFGCVLAVALAIAAVRKWSDVQFRFSEVLVALAILAAFPAWWLLQQYVNTGHPVGFLLHSPDRFEPLSGTSVAKILWHNAALQFVVQNIATCVLIGLLPAVDLWRTDKRVRFWLAVPLGALVLLSLVLLGGKGLTTHNPWRIASGWSLLLVPFAAYWLVSQVRLQSGSAMRRCALTALVVALCLFQTAAYARMTSTFSKGDLKAGRYIAAQRLQSVLIETSDWQYLNVVASSAQPGNFVYNSGADPLFPQDTLVRPGIPPDVQALRQRGIKYLLFKSPVYTYAIERDTAIKLLTQQGDWKLYDMRQ